MQPPDGCEDRSDSPYLHFLPLRIAVVGSRPLRRIDSAVRAPYAMKYRIHGPQGLPVLWGWEVAIKVDFHDFTLFDDAEERGQSVARSADIQGAVW